MSAPAAASCMVVLNHQREQIIQHHLEQGKKGAIVPCKTVARNCTLVENGRVVVKPIQPLPEAVDALQ